MRFFNSASEDDTDPTLNLDKTIKKFMKKNPLFVSPTHSLGDVAKAMGEEKRDIAVVKDKKGEVQGLVTSHDLFDAMRTWVLQKDMLEQIPSDVRELKVDQHNEGRLHEGVHGGLRPHRHKRLHNPRRRRYDRQRDKGHGGHGLRPHPHQRGGWRRRYAQRRSTSSKPSSTKDLIDPYAILVDDFRPI